MTAPGTVPNVTPAAAKHATAIPAHPAWHIPYATGPAWTLELASSTANRVANNRFREDAIIENFDVILVICLTQFFFLKFKSFIYEERKANYQYLWTTRERNEQATSLQVTEMNQMNDDCA